MYETLRSAGYCSSTVVPTIPIMPSLCLTVRAQAFALYEVGLSIERIREWTGLGRTTIFNIRDRAIERGYNRITNHAFRDVFFRNAPCSGRPRLLGEEELGK
jgi:hypothetical protein